MHEISLVVELVEECERHADGAGVTLVRVRHATTLPEAALRQAFELLTADGPLAGAALELEPVETRLRCACGFEGVLGGGDVAGHIAVCPSCGAISSPEGVAELELAELRTGPWPNSVHERLARQAVTPQGPPGPVRGPRR